SGVGTINKSDMMLAEVTNAMVIGFNVKPDAEARIIAEHSKIRVGSYSVIYDALDAVEAAMSGMTEPKYQEVYIGRAQVRNIFKISSVGVVAGSYVLDGKVQRGAKVVVKRRGETVYEGVMSGLKRFKDDAKEVSAGYECGISIDGYSDFVLDDEIEAYITERIK
ncbi:MAG: translation initiation factor IF-2, partial [Clostridia bacterium]|nr:translation initiation factor IF-2 [Clostridia bacterium]